MDYSITAAAATIDRSKNAQLVRNVQVGAIYARLLSIALASTFFSFAAIPIALGDIASTLEQVCWALASVAINALIVVIYVHRRRENRSDNNLARREIVGVMVALFLLGGYWAVIFGYYFISTAGLLYHIYVYMLWGALGTLAVSVLSDHLPAFLAYFLPPTIVMIGLAFGVGTGEYLVMAVAAIVCAAILIVFASTKYHSVTEELHLRFAMIDLALEANTQRDAAENANIAKSKFLAAASHDLRQPLHALTLLSSALHGSPITGSVRDIANDIQAAVGSLEQLFNALLDMSRLDAGVMQPECRHFDLSLLIRRIADEYTLEASAKALVVRCNLSQLAAYSDPLLLESILRNYVSNAIRYTRQGSICITCAVDDQQIRIDVRDTGIGIPLSKQVNIFDEFYQIGNPERDRNKGLGLGLAIVRRIAKLLDHRIGVESQPGQGACFFIVVPQGELALMTSEPSMPAVLVANLTGLRVLVIDDNAAIRDSTRTLLSQWGCDCITAGSEDEAVEAIHAQPGSIDVIIVDYRLREHRTGLQAIARLRNELDTEIPALLVSGDTAPERLREVAASGHTLVHKPLQPQVLRAFLMNTLRSLRA